MIKKGMFGVDDYAKFGGFLDTLERAGGVLFIYSPHKSRITVACRLRDVEKIKSVAGERVVKVSTHGGMGYVTVKV